MNVNTVVESGKVYFEDARHFIYGKVFSSEEKLRLFVMSTFVFERLFTIFVSLKQHRHVKKTRQTQSHVYFLRILELGVLKELITLLLTVAILKGNVYPKVWSYCPVDKQYQAYYNTIWVFIFVIIQYKIPLFFYRLYEEHIRRLYGLKAYSVVTLLITGFKSTAIAYVQFLLKALTAYLLITQDYKLTIAAAIVFTVDVVAKAYYPVVNPKYMGYMSYTGDLTRFNDEGYTIEMYINKKERKKFKCAFVVLGGLFKTKYMLIEKKIVELCSAEQISVLCYHALSHYMMHHKIIMCVLLLTDLIVYITTIYYAIENPVLYKAFGITDNMSMILGLFFIKNYIMILWNMVFNLLHHGFSYWSEFAADSNVADHITMRRYLVTALLMAKEVSVQIPEDNLYALWVKGRPSLSRRIRNIPMSRSMINLRGMSMAPTST